MKILNTQLEELGRRRQESFLQIMLGAVREDYPEKTSAMTDEEIRAHLEEGLRTSYTYGIELEGDVEAYIHLMFQLGFDFDQKVRWARDILNREDWSGSIRVSLLCAAHEGRIPGAGGGLFFP